MSLLVCAPTGIHAADRPINVTLDLALTSTAHADTVPAAVQALYLQGHEIATHTMTHVGYPSPMEIIGCREWLVRETGIPRGKINGFRLAGRGC